MKKVLILTITQGHLSIAQAVNKQLSPLFQTQVLQFIIKEFDLYLPLYKLFPSLYKIPYSLSQYKIIQEMTYKTVLKKYSKRILSAISDEKPDAVVSTYFWYDEICAEYGKKFNIPVYNTIANPHSIHPLEVCFDATKNLAFDEHAQKSLIEYGLDKSKIAKVGWFVRPEFKPARSRPMLRKKLGLLPDKLTFLISSGSDGTSMVLKILPLLFQVSTPLQIVFVAGNNKTLYKSLLLFKKTFQKANKKSKISIHVEAFVENMNEFMAACDLVVGKAGPNSVFESVAVHTPFFAITHIAGNEDGNLDLIRDYNIGFVEEQQQKAIKKLKKIIADPSILDQFKKSIELLDNFNSQAGEKLRNIISADLNQR